MTHASNGVNYFHGLRETGTQIVVALIALVAVVLGALIQSGVEFYSNQRFLIADFNTSELVFSSETIIQMNPQFATCKGKIANNRLMITNMPGQNPTSCAYALRQTQDRSYKDIGSIEATFRAGNSDETAESYIFLEMITYLNNLQLRANCGIRHNKQQYQAYFSVYSVGNPSELKCPPQSADQDATDGKCEMRFSIIQSLTPNRDYQLELRANPISINEFQCFVNGIGFDQYWVNIKESNFGADLLTNAIFERYINVNYAPNSTLTYTIDDVYERR